MPGKIFTFFLTSACLALCIFLASCYPTRFVPNDAHLLDNIIIKQKGSDLEKDELIAIVKQKPNRKILGIYRFHIRMYNLSKVGKKRRWKTWIGYTIGEEPVLIDTALMKRSDEQLRLFIHKRGYFDAQVHDTILFNKKKASVRFFIESGKRYKIDQVKYAIADSRLAFIVFADTLSAKIRPGKMFDENDFISEQTRITNLLKNHGYWGFKKEHIFYIADSIKKDHRVSVTIHISDRNFSTGPFDAENPMLPHEVYEISKVVIYPQHDVFRTSAILPDTITTQRGHLMVYNGKPGYRPGIFDKILYFEKGSLYNLKEVEDSYKRLSSLRVFKATYIDMEKVAGDSLPGKLNARILLTPAKRQTYTLAAEGTHSSGNLGVSGHLSYQNRNLFHGAEILEIKMKGALEVQQLAVSSSTLDVENEGTLLPFTTFNTIELGPELNLTLPGATLGFISKRLGRLTDPRLIFSSAFNYQRRPDYERAIFNISANYTWRKGKNTSHIFQPLDFNYIFVQLTPGFERIIDQLNDVLIRQSYRPLMIPSFMRYSYIWSNQENARGRKYYFRWNAQSSGNILSAFNELAGSQKFYNAPNNLTQDSSKSYRWFGIRYSQFILTDIDLRGYFNLTEVHQIATRFHAGYGKPYGNSVVLPFVKSYFGGGANDIRAWTARTLGPGTFPKDSAARYDQIGDIKLLLNAEYRFPLYRAFRAALFLDAGNIWLNASDEVSQRNGGQFRWDTWHQSLAIGTGFGLRWDFGFFIIRLDLGVPIHDPGYPAGERWVITQAGKRPGRLNLGIGYPF